MVRQNPLSPEQKRKVVHLHFADAISIGVLARRFNVARATIARIVKPNGTDKPRPMA